jgi:hypothetical protein
MRYGFSGSRRSLEIPRSGVDNIYIDRILTADDEPNHFGALKD